VETQEQAQTLRDLKCPIAQGFFFSKPLASGLADAVLLDEATIQDSAARVE
jgi:EAL domain-containing protein (putative c-di-GMP-specific phosphodiesterase class I)